jgi:hypothetical protein
MFDPVLHAKLWEQVKNVSRHPDGSYEEVAVEEITKLLESKLVEADMQGFKRGFKDAEQMYRDEAVIQELTTLLSSVPMPKLSYEQVENRIAELKSNAVSSKWRI